MLNSSLSVPVSPLLDVVQMAQHVLVEARALAPEAATKLDNQQGHYVLPPYCVWAFPRSNDGKRKGGWQAANQERGRQNLDEALAPSLVFLGAPAQGMAAAGLSLGQPEVELYARDARWQYRALNQIHDAVGPVPGGQWALARWAAPDGVDTTAFQRFYEYMTDTLASLGPDLLLRMLQGTLPAAIELPSKNDLKRITGFYENDESVFWNLLAHPEFFVLTDAKTSSEYTDRSLMAYRMIDRVTTRQPLSTRQSKSILVQFSKVAVALATGMGARLGWVLNAGKPSFQSEKTMLLTGWLWRLGERERRLARHLLLCDGDPQIGYDYLEQPYYAAAVLGDRVTDDRRYRHRIQANLAQAVSQLEARLVELEALGLDQAVDYLTKALAGLRHPSQDVQEGLVRPGVPCTIPMLPFEQASDVPLGAREKVEPLVMCDTSQDVRHLLGCATSLRMSDTSRDARHLSGCVTLVENQSQKLPNMRDIPEKQSQKLLKMGDTRPDGYVLSPEVHNNIYNNINNSTSVSQPESTGTHGKGKLTPADLADGLADAGDVNFGFELPTLKTAFVEHSDFLPGQKVAELPEIHDVKTSGQAHRMGCTNAYCGHAVEDPSVGWRKVVGDGEPLPEPLLEALGELLTPPQMDRINRECVWTPEGTWAIYQAIRHHGRGLSAPGGVLWNALRKPEKGECWLKRTGQAIRVMGWCELPEDETPAEDPSRRFFHGKVPYQRLPMDAKGHVRRSELLQQLKNTKATLISHGVPVGDQDSFEGDPEAQALWEPIRNHLQTLLPERTFMDWVKPCVGLALDRQILYIQCPSRVSRIWIEQQLTDELWEALEATGQISLQLKFQSAT